MQSVVIFDKNPSLAEALATQLSLPQSIDCKGFSSSVEIAATVQDNAPDLVLLDPIHLSLCETHDITDFRRSLVRLAPEVKLLCYSFDISAPMMRAAMDAGFHGCLSKYCTLQQLEVAVAAVLGGGVYFDSVFGEKLRDTSGDCDEECLSAREKEVLIRIARGLAPKQIAFDLSISAKTVETYKSRAVQKLGLADRSKVVEYALEHGWIS